MKLGLAGKTVIITGGASGIGRGAALAFLEEGANVAVCGRSQAKLDALATELNDNRLFSMRADVTDNNAMEAFASAVHERFGRVDVWINNAGASEPRALMDTDEAAFDRLVSTNFKSVFFMCKLAAKHLRASGGGVIINTSSFTSVVPTAGKALYGATKAAVNSLTQAFAAELAASNIRVVAVIPGYIETDMTSGNISENREWLVSEIPLNRLGTPEDTAGAFVFLASDAAKYITGIELRVTGGKLCVQNPMWSWR